MPPRIADSWEDADDEPEPELLQPKTLAADSSRERPRTADYPGPPPPTPSSPRSPVSGRVADRDAVEPLDAFLHPSQRQTAKAPSGSRDVRPEKSMAVADRMIAAGLGLRTPVRTDEQKKYDQAMLDREKKARSEKREAKRREEQEREDAKKAMWGD